MELSQVMVVTSNGLLIYTGHTGLKYEVVGGVQGNLNLRLIR